MTGPGDAPRRPRKRTPVFFGSFDWHSCAEMHWVLVRLLKAVGDVVPEVEIMAQPLPPDEFADWLGAFLPGVAQGEPASLFTPAVVSDSSDGQIAHLHGLNPSRAWCWRRLAETLPPADPRIPLCVAAMQRHAEASLPQVVDDDYMVTHWLAAYAVLLLT